MYDTERRLFRTESCSCAGVILLSWLMLGAHYRLGHIAGAAVCVLGLAALVVSDGSFTANEGDAYPHAALGDGIVLLGAVLYSLCNVMQEGLLGTPVHAGHVWIPCH